MAILLENDRRRSNRRQGRGKGDLEPIKINKGQEVTVHHGTGPQRKENSTFSWFEEFTTEWSESFILKKQKTTRRENE